MRGGGEAGNSQEAGKRNEDRKKKKWGVGEEMRKEAARGVTDEVMIGGKREEEGAGEEIGGTIPRRRGFTVTSSSAHPLLLARLNAGFHQGAALSGFTF